MNNVFPMKKKQQVLPRVQFTPSGYLGDLNDMIQRAHKQQGDRGTHAMLYMLVELEIQARIGR